MTFEDGVKKYLENKLSVLGIRNARLSQIVTEITDFSLMPNKDKKGVVRDFLLVTKTSLENEISSLDAKKAEVQAVLSSRNSLKNKLETDILNNT